MSWRCCLESMRNCPAQNILKNPLPTKLSRNPQFFWMIVKLKSLEIIITPYKLLKS